MLYHNNIAANLQLLPPQKLGPYIKRAIDKISRKSPNVSVCPDCGKVIEAYDLPYAYDPQSNDVWFASVCPECGAVIYSKE